eukprot:GHVO01000563.1.p1 GENE.GHVO01000563.1~~GHVO01000563.1.p1  ORF type:complete len:167 (+),score=13.04 GHVO01000563.1:53-553(+)
MTADASATANTPKSQTIKQFITGRDNGGLLDGGTIQWNEEEPIATLKDAGLLPKDVTVSELWTRIDLTMYALLSPDPNRQRIQNHGKWMRYFTRASGLKSILHEWKVFCRIIGDPLTSEPPYKPNRKMGKHQPPTHAICQMPPTPHVPATRKQKCEAGLKTRWRRV